MAYARVLLAGAACCLAGLAAANPKPPPPPPRPAAPPPRPMPVARPMPAMRPAPMQMALPMPMQRPIMHPLTQQTRPMQQPRPAMHQTAQQHGVAAKSPVASLQHKGTAEHAAPALANRSPMGGEPRHPLPTHDPRIGLATPAARPFRGEAAGPGAFRMPHADTRIGGAALHTHGLERGLAVARALPPRPFLRANYRRDVAAERVFIARQAAIFHNRNVRDFDAHELRVWREGLWRNEWHYGRRGWWWEAGGAWYAYPQPVLPYPADVVVPVIEAQPVVEGPDVSAQEGVSANPPDTQGEQAATSADVAAPSPDATGPAAQTPPAQDTASIPPLPPAPVGWYRCYAPSGVYPGLQSCGMSWELVQTAPLPGEL